jgi:hypothetical protein
MIRWLYKQHHLYRPAAARRLLLSFLLLGTSLPALAANQKIHGVGLDYFPGKPDPFATDVFDAVAFISRYGVPVESRQYWPGMVAELFPINDLALRNACLAGALGDPAVYDCIPTMVEQHDLAFLTRRPRFLNGEPGEPRTFETGNFYCDWWLNQGPDPGATPLNRLQITDPERPAGPFVEAPPVGWACPVYYVNVIPDQPACIQDYGTLCLGGDRFEVGVTWQTPDGTTGVGRATRLTQDTGTFSFFNAANLELMVKVLDGCQANGHFWVFSGGLTNVQVELRVKDRTTGVVKTYVSPLNTPYQPLQDTSAFTCP